MRCLHGITVRQPCGQTHGILSYPDSSYTGAIICGRDEIKKAYETGMFVLRRRLKAIKGGKEIVITGFLINQ